MITIRQSSRHRVPFLPHAVTPRRGIFLVEMIVVITAVGIILAATGVLLHFMLQMNNEVRERTHTVAMVGRLAEQFRRDVHQAHNDWNVAADHRAAELHLAEGKIVKWRMDEEDGVVRREQAPGDASREDSFRLPKGTTAAFGSKPQMVMMRIESPGTDGPALVVEALASRDARLIVEEEKP